MRWTRTTETPEVQVAVDGLPPTMVDYTRQKVSVLLSRFMSRSCSPGCK
jgi:hypothetical protein